MSKTSALRDGLLIAVSPMRYVSFKGSGLIDMEFISLPSINQPVLDKRVEILLKL
jgi:hypothetical protein